MQIDFGHSLAGLLVGVLVGLTGVGGGSLMAPVLILLIGVAPATAIGTDLWFSAITKTVGSTFHHRLGGIEWQIVRRLATGSIPAVVVTLFILHTTGTGQIKSGFIITALGFVLVLTAIVTLLRGKLRQLAIRIRAGRGEMIGYLKPAATVLCGAILGVIVTLTSIGAGALGATMLLMLHPQKLDARTIVGTDIAHAVPLTFVAALGHMWLGSVDFVLLISLLAGSIPGIIAGSFFAYLFPDKLLSTILAVILALVGVRMLF